MSKGLAVILSAAVGFLIGWLVHTPSPPPPPPVTATPTALALTATPSGPTPVPTSNGSVAVTVITDPSDVKKPEVRPETAVISTEDLVLWASDSTKKHVRIEFEKKIFANMKTLGNGRFLVKCEKRNCVSDDVLVKPDPKVAYKYWQFAINPGTHKETYKDGWVIIDRSP